MNRKRLVVVLEERLHIYDLATMKIVHTIETRPNPQGKGEVSSPLPLLPLAGEEGLSTGRRLLGQAGPHLWLLSIF